MTGRNSRGHPGEIRQIDLVDDASRTITLKTALTAGLFPVDGQDLTDPDRHTRIKRWDQAGIVRDSGGNIYPISMRLARPDYQFRPPPHR